MKGEAGNVENANDIWKWNGTAASEGDCCLGDGGGWYGSNGDTL